MKAFQLAIGILLLFYLSLRASLPSGYVVGWGYNHNLWSEPSGPVPSMGPSSGLVKIDGQVLSNAVAVTPELILKNDGKVAGFVGLSNVVAIAANLALMSDGRVVALGGNKDDPNVPVDLTNVISLGGMDLVLKSDGRPFAWGKWAASRSRKPFIPEGLSNVVALGSKNGDGIALRTDGTVVQWSFNGKIELEENPLEVTNGRVIRSLVQMGDYKVIDGLSNVVAIAVGAGQNLALESDGTVFGWGANNVGQATGIQTTNYPLNWGPYASDTKSSHGLVTIDGNILTNVVGIAAGYYVSMALKSDGTVVTWGFSPNNAQKVPAGLNNVVAIAAGDNYCLAITTNRDVAEKFR